jgi:hypothetical protein
MRQLKYLRMLWPLHLVHLLESLGKRLLTGYKFDPTEQVYHNPLRHTLFSTVGTSNFAFQSTPRSSFLDMPMGPLKFHRCRSEDPLHLPGHSGLTFCDVVSRCDVVPRCKVVPPPQTVFLQPQTPHQLLLHPLCLFLLLFRSCCTMLSIQT